MTKTDKISRIALVAGVILLFNSGAAIITGGLIAASVDSCPGSCLAKVGLFFVWGSFGLVSGILVIRRHTWALWGGCIFFLFQSFAIRTPEFFYNLNVGLSLYISVSNDGSVLSFNILAWIAIAFLIYEYIRRNDIKNNFETEAEGAG